MKGGKKKGPAQDPSPNTKCVIFIAKDYPAAHKKIVEILSAYEFNEKGEI